MGKIKKILSILVFLILLTEFVFFDQGLCLSVNEEKELSRKIIANILKHCQVIEDSVITEYVEKIGKKILSVLPVQPFTYRFYVLNEHSYNAFAIPGGHIFINSGLIEALSDGDELAGILAHEIAHVVCRHISQKIDRSKKISIATIAGIAAGIFLGAGPLTGALVTGSIAAGQSVSLAYSREDEMQADQMGMTYMLAAGYNGKAMIASLEKIRTKQWFGSEQIPTYLSTHPASEERIAYISSWLETNTNKQKQFSNPSVYEFLRARARLIGLYGEEQTCLMISKSEIKKYPDNPMTHYGYGLVLDRIGNRKKALLHFKKALEKAAFEPYILSDIGRIYFFEGELTKALSSLKGSISINPKYVQSHFFLGRTQLTMGRLKQGLNSFQKVIELKPDHSQALYFLGNIYGQLKEFGYAHFYLGIYYKNQYKFRNAAFHLEKAIKYLKDSKKRDKAKQMLKKVLKKEAALKVHEKWVVI